MKKLHRGGSNPDGEPLSAGRVEKVCLSRSADRDRHEIKNVFPLKMATAKRRPF